MRRRTDCATLESYHSRLRNNDFHERTVRAWNARRIRYQEPQMSSPRVRTGRLNRILAVRTRGASDIEACWAIHRAPGEAAAA